MIDPKEKENTTMLVLKCGIRKFLDGEDLARAEMRAAARYYQCCVDIERWRRREYAAIRSSAVSGLAEIDAAYGQLDEWLGEHTGPSGKRGEIREKRRQETARTRRPTKRVPVDQEIDAIAELKMWRHEAGQLARPLRAQFAALIEPPAIEHARRAKALRVSWGANDGDRHAKRRSIFLAREQMLDESTWAEQWKNLQRLEIAADQLRSWVKGARLLSVGTYYAVQRRDFPAACKRPPPRPDGEPRRPRQRPAFSPRRLRRIGWELKGVTWGALLEGCASDVRVYDVRDVGGSKGGHVEQRMAARMRLRNENQPRLPADPDYYRPLHDGDWNVTMEVQIHRPIPADTRVAWVYLVPEERASGVWDFSLQFTLEPSAPLILRAPGSGAVRVDLCWTQTGDTLTVARLNGEPLDLPTGGSRGGVVSGLRRAEYLRGVTDKYFDVARDETIKRLAAFPESVQRACAGIHQWRSPRKLERVSLLLLPSERAHAFWQSWRDSRKAARMDLFELDVAAFAAATGLGEREVFPLWLDTWRRKHAHLDAIASGQRLGAMRRRTDFYRLTAARLSTQYATCVVGGAVDLAALALRDKSEDKPSELHQAARHNRQLACVHELKTALEHAFGPERYSERSADEQIPASARASVADASSDVAGDRRRAIHDAAE